MPLIKAKSETWDIGGGFTAVWWKGSHRLRVTWAPGEDGGRWVGGSFTSFADAKLGARAFVEELKGRGIFAGDLRREADGLRRGGEKLRTEQVMFTVDARRAGCVRSSRRPVRRIWPRRRSAWRRR